MGLGDLCSYFHCRWGWDNFVYPDFYFIQNNFGSENFQDPTNCRNPNATSMQLLGLCENDFYTTHPLTQKLSNISAINVVTKQHNLNTVVGLDAKRTVQTPPPPPTAETQWWPPGDSD